MTIRDELARIDADDAAFAERLGTWPNERLARLSG